MKLSRAVIFLASLCVANLASAQVRVGVIYQPKIREFVASPQYQKLEKTRSNQLSKPNTEQAEKQLLELKTKYQNEINQLSDEQKQSIRRKLMRLSKLIKDKKQSYLKKEEKRREARRKLLRKRWDDSVSAVAKRKKINIVLEEHGMYYADQVIDITEEVKQEILKNMQRELQKQHKSRRKHRA